MSLLDVANEVDDVPSFASRELPGERGHRALTVCENMEQLAVFDFHRRLGNQRFRAEDAALH